MAPGAGSDQRCTQLEVVGTAGKAAVQVGRGAGRVEHVADAHDDGQPLRHPLHTQRPRCSGLVAIRDSLVVHASALAAAPSATRAAADPGADYTMCTADRERSNPGPPKAEQCSSHSARMMHRRQVLAVRRPLLRAGDELPRARASIQDTSNNQSSGASIH